MQIAPGESAFGSSYVHRVFLLHFLQWLYGRKNLHWFKYLDFLHIKKSVLHIFHKTERSYPQNILCYLWPCTSCCICTDHMDQSSTCFNKILCHVYLSSLIFIFWSTSVIICLFGFFLSSTKFLKGS